MILYGLYLLTFLFLHYFAKNWSASNIKKIIVQCVGCFVLLFVFYGFRDIGILNDTAHYYEHFSDLISYNTFDEFKIWDYDDTDRFNVGYLIYENIVGHIWRNPYSIIMITAFITTLTWVYFVKSSVKNVALCFFVCMVIGILGTQYSGCRQGLATCVFLLSYKMFFEKEKMTYFYIGCLFAISFHNSAVVLLLLPLLNKLEINRRNVTILLTLAVVFALSLQYLFAFTGYDETTHYYQDAIDRETLPIANMVSLAFIILMMLLSRQSYVNAMSENKMIWWLSILNLIFRFLALFVGIMGRYTNYFAIFTIILFVNSMCTGEMEYKYRSKRLLILISFVYIFITLYLRPEWYHLIPYSFYDFSLDYHDTKFGY